MIQNNDIPLKATKSNRKQFVLKLVAIYSLIKLPSPRHS